MNTHAPLLSRLSVLCCCGAVCLAAARQPPQEAPAGEPPLRGPVVRDDLAHTLVHSDMRGKFQKIQGRSEEAALGELGIDPDRREMARGVIAERAAAVRDHLIENIDLVKESTDALKAGDNARARKLGQELYDRFDPAHVRAPLLVPLEAVLSPEESASVKRLVDEYWAAWIAEEKKKSPKASDQAIQDRLCLEVFQAEVRAVYEYSLRPYQQKLEKIYETVDPTPEQRAAIRGAVISHIKEARLNPSEAQRGELAREIYSVLDEGQRMKLFAAALSAL